jgi:trk system potassium uptake protein TrkH
VNARLDLQILGWLLVGLGALHCVPIAGAIFYGEPLLPYLTSAAVACLYGLPIALTMRPVDRRMRVRDGFVVVVAAWLLASAFGALPYLLVGQLGPVDALFEAVAGFTTTGATTLTRIEGTPPLPCCRCSASAACSSSAPRCRARSRTSSPRASP